MKMIDLILFLLFVIALSILAVGLKAFLQSKQFLATSVKTNATVMENIAMESRDNNSTRILYAPLLAYQVQGKETTYVPNMRSNPAAYHVGDQVKIAYNPKSPNDVRIISYWGVYLSTIILLALGLPVFVISSGYFLFKWGII